MKNNNNQLIMCKECNTLLVKGVKKCHYCGKDQRSFFIQHKMLFSVGIWLLLFAYNSVVHAAQTPMISAIGQTLNVSEAIASTSTETSEITKTTGQFHKEEIGNLFDLRDGSNYVMVEEIKRTMRDPKSFKHIETLFADNGDGTIIISMSYKGRNIFGFITLHEAYALQDIDTGEIEDVSYQ